MNKRYFHPALRLLLCAAWALIGTRAWGQNSAARAVPAPHSPSSSSALAQRLQAGGVKSPEKRVLALYYPWYQTLQYSYKWAHYDGVETANKRMNSHAHYPAQGPYDSNDPAVIDLHLAQAEGAGIDTLVCSWWGPNDPTDRALRLLLMRAAKRSVKICVLWKQLSAPSAPQSSLRDLTYLVQTFGKQPAYLRVEGKPVVFAFERVCRSASHAVWADALNAVNKRFPPGVLVVGDGSQQADMALWDGVYNLGTAAAMTGQTPQQCALAQHESGEATLLLCKRLNRLSIVNVMPGYDDRKPNATSGIATRVYLNRQDGQLYDALWQQAIADDPDWILVNSFNQWHAGTEIEPSVELGDKYLRLTRRYAAQFKRQAGTTE